MQTPWSIQFESDWAGSKLRNSGMMWNYLLRNRIKYSRKIDRVHFQWTGELYLNGHILDAPRSIFHRKVPTRRLYFSSLLDNLSLKCKPWICTRISSKNRNGRQRIDSSSKRLKLFSSTISMLHTYLLCVWAVQNVWPSGGFCSWTDWSIQKRKNTTL